MGGRQRAGGFFTKHQENATAHDAGAVGLLLCVCVYCRVGGGGGEEARVGAKKPPIFGLFFSCVVDCEAPEQQTDREAAGN